MTTPRESLLSSPLYALNESRGVDFLQCSGRTEEGVRYVKRLTKDGL